MALEKNKYTRLQNVKNIGRDEVVSFDQTISRLEEDIRKLKIEYDIYFGGGVKRPPHEARARFESQLKRLADDRSMTFAQRFLYNSLMSRFTSFRELWRRNFKQRGEDFF